MSQPSPEHCWQCHTLNLCPTFLPKLLFGSEGDMRSASTWQLEAPLFYLCLGKPTFYLFGFIFGKTLFRHWSKIWWLKIGLGCETFCIENLVFWVNVKASSCHWQCPACALQPLCLPHLRFTTPRSIQTYFSTSFTGSSTRKSSKSCKITSWLVLSCPVWSDCIKSPLKNWN